MDYRVDSDDRLWVLVNNEYDGQVPAHLLNTDQRRIMRIAIEKLAIDIIKLLLWYGVEFVDDDIKSCIRALRNIHAIHGDDQMPSSFAIMIHNWESAQSAQAHECIDCFLMHGFFIPSDGLRVDLKLHIENVTELRQFFMPEIAIMIYAYLISY